MTNFVSFTEGGEVSHVDHLVFNLVDPAADTGSVTSLISKSLKRPGDRGSRRASTPTPSSTTGPSAPS